MDDGKGEAGGHKKVSPVTKYGDDGSGPLLVSSQAWDLIHCIIGCYGGNSKIRKVAINYVCTR